MRKRKSLIGVAPAAFLTATALADTAPPLPAGKAGFTMQVPQSVALLMSPGQQVSVFVTYDTQSGSRTMPLTSRAIVNFVGTSVIQGNNILLQLVVDPRDISRLTRAQARPNAVLSVQ